MPTTIPLTQLQGPAKGETIRRLLDALELDLEKTNLLPPTRNALLEDLKVFTRETEDADDLFSPRGVKVTARHAIDSNSPTTARLAMRCLGNILFFRAPLRQAFVDLDYPREVAERMRSDNREDELLTTRLLFLCTYETTLDFTQLFSQKNLADTINANLSRHAKVVGKTGRKTAIPDMDSMALNETLKLMFNLANYYPDQRSAFTKSLLPILKMLNNIKLPQPPLLQPVNALIHALIHLDLEDKKASIFAHNPIFPLFDAKCNINRLCSILYLSVQTYSDSELEQYASPILQVLVRIAEFAPPAAKAHMCTLLLPSDAERDQPLGKSNTLAAYLLRVSGSPVASNMRRFVPALMFELSGKDVKAFVQTVGYGFAAGFLATNKIEVPESAMQAWSTGSTDPTRVGFVEGDEEVDDVEESVGELTHKGRKGSRFDVNPITGQRRDMEPQDTGPDMTEDEKLREAEKLFVLFERLKATGVVNVENPVGKAMRDGRFEEMD